MPITTSTPYSRDLGDELRHLREEVTPFNGHAMALNLGWDPSKVSNIEKGKARASDIDLVQYLAACGKDLEYIEEFRRRYYHAFDLYFAQVPDNLRTIAMTEAMATKIIAYDVLTPNGLLQAEGYARELFMTSAIGILADVEMYVRLRIERQAILRRARPPECMFYLHELALKLLVGDARAKEDQLLQLLFNTHRLRIVPMACRGLVFSSSRNLYEFAKASPVVYEESDTARLFAQDKEAVETARKLARRLDEVALDGEQSKRLLMNYVSALRKDPDDPRTDLP